MEEDSKDFLRKVLREAEEVRMREQEELQRKNN